MIKNFLKRSGEFLSKNSKKINFDKLRQLCLALLGLGLVSLGIGLIFIPAGVIAGGIALIIINIGWEDKRT